MSWLAEALAACTLSSEGYEYLMGRAARRETIEQSRLTTWACTSEVVPEPVFVDRYGPHGEQLEGRLICPFWSPRGAILGFEARRLDRKDLSRYLLPEAAWQPIFFGTRTAMPKIWAGAELWIVEGQFDIYPLEWVVPPENAILGAGRAKLTDKQVEFLCRFPPKMINMAFDTDEAGRKGTLGWADAAGKRHWGALDVLQRAGLPCRDWIYEGGKDPGEIWDRGGVEGLKRAFSGARHR